MGFIASVNHRSSIHYTKGIRAGIFTAIIFIPLSIIADEASKDYLIAVSKIPETYLIFIPLVISFLISLFFPSERVKKQFAGIFLSQFDGILSFTTGLLVLMSFISVSMLIIGQVLGEPLGKLYNPVMLFLCSTIYIVISCWLVWELLNSRNLLSH